MKRRNDGKEERYVEREARMNENIFVKTAREEQGKLCDLSYMNMSESNVLIFPLFLLFITCSLLCATSLLISLLHYCSIFLPFFPLLFSSFSFLCTILLHSSSLLLSLLAYSSLFFHPLSSPLLLPPEGISQFNIPLTLSNPIITPEKCPTADTLGTKT